VRYGLVKFVEQPALASLAADFPSDFTPAKLAQAQARFERLAASTHRAHEARGRAGAARRRDAHRARRGVRARRGGLDARDGRGRDDHVLRHVVIKIFATLVLWYFGIFALASPRFFFFALEAEETENKWTQWTQTLAC
jgi:hypothetical protein